MCRLSDADERRISSAVDAEHLWDIFRKSADKLIVVDRNVTTRSRPRRPEWAGNVEAATSGGGEKLVVSGGDHGDLRRHRRRKVHGVVTTQPFGLREVAGREDQLGRPQSELQNFCSAAAPAAGRWIIHQWPSPSSTATSALACPADQRARASPPV